MILYFCNTLTCNEDYISSYKHITMYINIYIYIYLNMITNLLS